MSGPLVLRPYQERALSDLWQWFSRETGNPLVVLPTGAGKSLVIAEWCKLVFDTDPDACILVLAHVRELIQQNAAELVGLWPEAPWGIYSAGLGRRDIQARLLFASIQSIHKKAYNLPRRVDMVLVDEAHLISRNQDGMYGRFLADLKAINPAVKIIGLTATPFRLDSGRLDTGDDAMFDGIAHDTPVRQLIDDGYLAPPMGWRQAAQINTDGVGTRGGEFIAAQLEAEALDPAVVNAIADRIVDAGQDRKGWLIFGCTVKHCEALAEALNARGYAGCGVFGDTEKRERDRIIADFKAQRLRFLCSQGVLTTGFNARHVDMIALARPTKSTGLYVQMIGRGTRLSPETGKFDCLAEGSLVLTNCGLVPIEHVTTAMKVWDGVEFVEHCGSVFRGEREVITYAGITATADHQVWTKEGWKALGECALEQTPILVTGYGGQEIRATENRYRRDCQDWGEKPAISSHRMHDLWCADAQGLLVTEGRNCGLPQMWEPAECPTLACSPRECGQSSMHQPQSDSIRAVWRQGDRISLQKPLGDGAVDSGEFRFAPRKGAGSDQQQRPLRAGKPSLPDAISKPVEHKGQRANTENAPFPKPAPECEVCRCNTLPLDRSRADFRANSRTVRAAVAKTKRRVWDILNAGPRNRFTAQGLLVHNCLILDFGGNIARHGPFDDPAIPDKKKKGEGPAPFKECPECQCACGTMTRICPACGFEFPPPERLVDVRPAEKSILSVEPEWLEVDEASYRRHEKPGKPVSMRVEYRIGMTWHREWVCFEHQGYARTKAESWWLRRAPAPVPRTVAEAISRAHEIGVPSHIRVKRSGKYDEIVAFRFDPARQAA